MDMNYMHTSTEIDMHCDSVVSVQYDKAVLYINPSRAPRHLRRRVQHGLKVGANESHVNLY